MPSYLRIDSILIHCVVFTALLMGVTAKTRSQVDTFGAGGISNSGTYANYYISSITPSLICNNKSTSCNLF